MTYKPATNLATSRARKINIVSLSKLLLLGIFAFSKTYALPSDTKQPVKLTADKATFNEKTGVTEYTGRVTISQGSLNISANRLTIYINDDGSIKSAQATGSPATMQQQLSKGKGLSKGSAGSIAYDAKTGIILLKGSAKLSQDGASISGEHIRYSLSAGDFEAKRGSTKQVELIIPPNPNLSPQSVR